jgi:hypothetical protein
MNTNNISGTALLVIMNFRVGETDLYPILT